MKKSIRVLVMTTLLLGCVSGCKNNEIVETTKVQESTQEEQTKETTISETEPESEPTDNKPVIGVVSLPSMSGKEYQPLKITAKVPAYEIKSDLSNIVNMSQFSNLNEKQRAMIAKNGFVVIPTDEEQLFYIYEDNTYKLVSNFVTADSVLQLYHIYYDYMLRNVEQNSLYEKTISLNQLMTNALLAQYGNCSKPEIKKQIEKAAAYFAVANKLLDQPDINGLPAQVKEYVDAELNNINSEGVAKSIIFDEDVDYSLFKVRGHYTRTEELQKYFKAFSWYGVMSMPLEKGDNLISALVIADTLDSNKEARQIWDDIYAVTSFMVGSSDDLTPIEVAEQVREVYGELPVPDALPEKISEVKERIELLRAPKIVNKKINPEEEQKRELRFMGQRYLTDADILQRLCDAKARPMPSGLDVLAAYGSEQAEKLLDEFYEPKKLWPEYENKLKETQEELKNKTVKEQTADIYNGWLYTMNALTTPKKDGYPMFMQTEAWSNKSINSALASWAELRHDTILYGKQSGVECGGGEEPPEVIAYVEPDPEFFHRLYWLTETTYEGLKERGLLDYNIEYKTETMMEELEFLENCAAKELNGEDLSAEECMTLLCFGGTLEYISSSIAEASDWYCVESDTDRHMAVVADVHRAYENYLEEAVGCANAIYVAVYQRGQVYLTRGAVFDYYEFSSSERLTDEQWQEKIKSGNTPGRVPYADTFLSPEKEIEVSIPAQPYSTGC